MAASGLLEELVNQLFQSREPLLQLRVLRVSAFEFRPGLLQLPVQPLAGLSNANTYCIG